MRFEIIKQAPDYIIFENGSILNCLTDRFLKCTNGKGFYKTVRLRNNNKPKTYKLHRLLAEAFIYKPEGKNYVNHKDGDKLNNHLSNLEWCTHQENMKHARDIGLISYQDVHRLALLKSKQKTVLDTQTGIYYDSIKDAYLANSLTRKTIYKKSNTERFIKV